MGSEKRRNEVIMEGEHLLERSDSSRDYREEEEIDGGWGWLVVCACFCTTFVLDGIGYSFGMFMKPLKHEMRESNFGVASIGSVQVRLYYFVLCQFYFCYPFFRLLFIFQVVL